MEYRRLDRTGLEILVIRFGAIGTSGVEAIEQLLYESRRKSAPKKN